MFDVDSPELILINLNDNKVLYEQNADTEVAVASLTKIMTAILTLENSNKGDLVVITDEMVSGLEEFAVAGLTVGQELSVEELLYLTMLPSAGDAAQALAIHVAGSIDNFAALMNQKAETLNLGNTHFSNPVGQDEDNYSTARDISTLLEYALNNLEFKTVFEAYEYYSPALDRTFYKTVDENGVILGAKTGFTYDAGRCLASTAILNDVPYLLVNLGADYTTNDHINDALAIYDYFSNNYSYQVVKKAEDVYLTLPVYDSEITSLDFRLDEDITAYLKNDFDFSTLVYDYDGLEVITNDNKQGDVLGNFKIKNGDDVLYETTIYFDAEIDFYPYWLWNTGVVFGGLVILTVIISLISRKIKQKH